MSLVLELRALRKGRGLTLDKLSRSPGLLQALGTQDALEASRLLTERLASLGTGDKVKALQQAFGLIGPKHDLLTARRNDFATDTKRSVDTIENYENEIIEELAVALSSPLQVGRPAGRLWVSGLVRQGVISLVTVQHGDDVRQPQTYHRADKFAPSSNLLLAFRPDDWAPTDFIIVVNFLDKFPQACWSWRTVNALEVPLMPNRKPLAGEPEADTMRYMGGWRSHDDQVREYLGLGWSF